RRTLAIVTPDARTRFAGAPRPVCRILEIWVVEALGKAFPPMVPLLSAVPRLGLRAVSHAPFAGLLKTASRISTESSTEVAVFCYLARQSQPGGRSAGAKRRTSRAGRFRLAGSSRHRRFVRLSLVRRSAKTAERSPMAVDTH